jgi:AcrR family transcriptional regulator
MPKVKSKGKPKDPDTRARIIEASVALFRHRGYAGTGLKAIVEASDAPYGSVYHFFPGGKEELGVAALEAGGVTYLGLVELVFAEGVDVVDATREFCAGAATVLETTNYADACPIATMALEVASASEPMRIAAAHAFDSWLVVLERRFTDAGMVPTLAREIAVELFCAIEGAFLLARAQRSTEAFAVIGESTAAKVAAALDR